MSLTQLVSYGAQDIYLTADPEITFFKVVYRRYTNFAIETIALSFNGTADFGKQCNVLITRNGDLVTRMYLQIQLAKLYMNRTFNSEEERSLYLFAYVRELGNFIINNIRFEIGGTQIDKHYGHWMSTWHDLTKDVNNEPAYRALVGDVDILTELRKPNSSGYFTDDYTLYVPLIFWCNTNTGLALPLIALQYHEVRLWFEFNKFEDLIVHSNNVSMSNLSNGNGVFAFAQLLVDYVYIDTEERRRFAQIGHEYLINQLQFTGVQSINSNPLKITCTFNHPTKEFIWKMNSAYYCTGNAPFLCYSNKDFDWDRALDYAAQNLISGSVKIGETTEVDELNVSLSQGDYNDWNTVNVISTNAFDSSMYALFSFIPGAGVDDQVPPSVYIQGIAGEVLDPNGPTPYSMLYRLSSFVNPTKKSYNLTSYVYEFQVLIYYAVVSALGVGSDLTYKVTATRHDVQVRDVSIPVDQWADTRYSVDSSGYSPRDIWAILPLVDGLLINNAFNPMKVGNIQLNGQDRFQPREGAYFNLIETYNYHHSTPSPGKNVFSFALYPEQHQPSGTCNLSRIDTTLLNIGLYTEVPNLSGNRYPPALSIVNSASRCFVYACNYNVLRVMSGMAGLAYSN
jgi:hypothetical protein